MPMRDNTLLFPNLLEINRFPLSRLTNIFFPFQLMGKNMEKKWKKWKINSALILIFEGSGKLILLFQIHASKNEIAHAKL
jgi:hypothetical protein